MASRALDSRADDAATMEQLGALVAREGRRGQRLWLSGPLAAGKTTFARGYLRGLGFEGAVKSPTFTLVETYQLDKGTVHHFDLYRVADPAELEFIGVDDYFDGVADVLIEWPERGAESLPAPDLEIVIEPCGRSRKVRIRDVEGRYLDLFEALISNEFNK